MIVSLVLQASILATIPNLEFMSISIVAVIASCVTSIHLLGCCHWNEESSRLASAVCSVINGISRDARTENIAGIRLSRAYDSQVFQHEENISICGVSCGLGCSHSWYAKTLEPES